MCRLNSLVLRVKVGTLWGSAQLYWDGGPIMLWFVIVFKVVFKFVDLGGPGWPAGRPGDRLDVPALGLLPPGLLL